MQDFCVRKLHYHKIVHLISCDKCIIKCLVLFTQGNINRPRERIQNSGFVLVFLFSLGQLIYPSINALNI